MDPRLSSLPFLFSFLLLFTCIPSPATSAILVHSILPNFTATHVHYVDYAGAFLSSGDGAFRATLHDSHPDKPNAIFFSVVHVPTSTEVWSANRDRAVTNSAVLSLTVAGLSLTDSSGDLVWSTPLLDSPVESLRLLNTGNLVLFAVNNVSLWESFEYPTDTLVIGQRLAIGSEISAGNYRLTVSVEEGLILQWLERTYWKLTKDSRGDFSYVEMNSTGLYLYGKSGSVFAGVSLGFSDFRIARVEYRGMFSIGGFFEGGWLQDFAAPAECEVPLCCGKLGLCEVISGTNNKICSCPDGFKADMTGIKSENCVPSDDSFVLPSNNSSCDSENSGSSNVSYASLGIGIDYAHLSEPDRREVDFSGCRDLCTRNCSCLGFFFGNSSGSCHVLEDQLGSFVLNKGFNDRLGYIKTFAQSSSTEKRIRNVGKKGLRRVKLKLILLGSLLALIIFVMAVFLRKKLSTCSGKDVAADLERWNSSSSAEIMSIFSIPGLPLRFEYDELVEATGDFKEQIGKGSFGTVFRGTMRDNSVVAVKKITSLGVRGRKAFHTEIAIIGNVRHVNLVRLRGFCTAGRQHFLVYEFMSKGSLEKILFDGGFPILEWRDRFGIALRAARALAYLHGGCQKKIIHCDVKPENILLSENSAVKISDFGLSKLLDHESSKLLTALRGTRGYLAPEWLNGSGITDKSDVYSFGMVLLELVSGKRNCSFPGVKSDISFVSSFSSSGAGTRVSFFPSLALEMHKKRRYSELADSRLDGRVIGEEIEMMVKIGLCCLHIAPALRPSMDNVVAMLEGRSAVCDPIFEALRFLVPFGGRL